MPPERGTGSGRWASSPLSVDVLGPVRVRVAGETVDVAAKKPRALIAMLAMDAGRVVSADALIDGLWGDEPPDSALNALQVYVAGLRRRLGSERERLRTRAPGYVLEVEREAVDALRFEDTVAGSAAEDGATQLTQALAAWRGAPFEDLGDVPFAQAHITRLSELRQTAVEGRIEGDLAAGRHVELIPELETLVAAEPYRERLWRQLSMALYRAGRQADALAAIRRVRVILRDDLGLDPGPPLVALERAILQQDPALTPAVPDPVGIRVPAPPSRLIGRDLERRDLIDLVRGTRLVTLTGLGGVGKTRLATDVGLDAATHEGFPGGVVFVDLSGTADASLIVAETTRTAGVTAADAPTSALAARLGDRPALLILDNLEQIQDPGIAVVDLLRSIPNVHVLATSRTPLRVTSEHVVHLEPLDVDAAVQLFRERASAGQDRDETGSIRAIAERLDGIPLAIELAAAASRAVSPEDLLERVAKRLPLPDGPRDLPARQRTLEATLDWSLGLLGPRSRELLDVVTIFEAPFGLEAVETISDEPATALDSIAALVEASLISVEGSRYRMLPSIRDVIRERIDGPRATELADRQAAWVASASEAAYGEMHGGDEVPARRRIAAVLPDVRAALAHLIRTDRHEEAAHIVLWTTLVWFHEGLFGEYQKRLAATRDGSLSDRTRAEVDVMRGVFGWLSGDALHSLGFMRDGVEVLRSQRPTSVVLVNGLCHLAAAAAEQGRSEEAMALADEAVEVAHQVDDPGSLPMALELAGYVAHTVGDADRAVAAMQAAVGAARTIESAQLCTGLAGLAVALADVGRQAEAIQAGWEAIEVADRVGSAQQIAETVVTVAPVLGRVDPSVIAQRVADAIASYIAYGALPSAMDACLNLARLAVESHPDEAARLVGAMEARGRDRVPEDVRRLGDALREQLGPQAYAHQHALGGALGDDDVGRLARDLAAGLRAAPIA